LTGFRLRLYSLARGRPRLANDVGSESQGVRRVADLASVTAIEVAPSNRRIQYWTYAGVAHEHDRELLSALPLSYDLTFISARPIGWERPKTLGHVHVSPPGVGGAELYEVLEGSATFLVQDLGPGPSASFVALITADAGDCVVIPPWAHHVTSNTGASPLVVANIVSRSVEHDYARLEAARGAAYYQRTDGHVVPNPTYRRVPPVTRTSATEWSDAAREGPIYHKLSQHPLEFAWLEQAGHFERRYAELAALMG
jgi:oxalate decarboxylase/phosphoglucose isomerase-like protein (cupin superfamily)